jgi:predicted RNA-binding protein YlqC (UPF0109 family)
METERGKQPRVKQEAIDDLRSLVEFLAKKVVDHPDAVEVIVVPGSYRLLAELHTDPRDVGQVVGKNAYLASSFRSFVSALGGRHGVRMEYDYITEKDNAANRGRDERSVRSAT